MSEPSTTAARELAEILRVMGHPDRLRIVNALSGTEKDVSTLLCHLDLPGPRVSQHLSLLRAYRIVDDRRAGRHHFYRLTQPRLTGWIIEGLRIIEQESSRQLTTNANKHLATRTEDAQICRRSS